MATLTNITKNAGTLTGISKNSGSISAIGMNSLIGYLLTDTPDFILVGSASDEVLILKEADVLTNIAKN